MQKKIIYSDFEKGCLFYTIETVKTLKLIEKNERSFLHASVDGIS